MDRDDGRTRPIAILESLGAIPAVPFQETGVRNAIGEILSQRGIGWETDGYGNLIARVVGATTGRPPIAFVAHMDHPGFEFVEVNETTGRARMLGRTPDTVFAGRFALKVFGAEKVTPTTAWTAGSSDPDDREPRARLLDVELESPVRMPAYAVFDLPEFENRTGVIHMRACDDLAGCAAILAMMERVVAPRPDVDVYGVFTRAEEEGLIGARLLAAERRLPAETIVVSVESSRALPGAEHGSGPVIRVGDAAATFSADAESVLLAAREQLAQREPSVSIQRQLMSGGVCEASAFVVHGYRATGVAFPLGHYHNGLGEDAINAEFIHVSDFLGGVELLVEAVRAAESGEEPPVYSRLRAPPVDAANRLLEG